MRAPRQSGGVSHRWIRSISHRAGARRAPSCPSAAGTAAGFSLGSGAAARLLKFQTVGPLLKAGLSAAARAPKAAPVRVTSYPPRKRALSLVRVTRGQSAQSAELAELAEFTTGLLVFASNFAKNNVLRRPAQLRGWLHLRFNAIVFDAETIPQIG